MTSDDVMNLVGTIEAATARGEDPMGNPLIRDTICRIKGKIAPLLRDLVDNESERADTPCELDSIITDGSTYAQANARLFFTPWSSSFAHGSDTLVPIVGIIRNILESGETLASIREIRWLKPITCDLQLAVQARAFKMSELIGKDISLAAQFISSNGRMISLIGKHITNRPIRRHFCRNPFAVGVVSTSPSEFKQVGDDEFKVQLKLPNFVGPDEMLNNNAMLTVPTVVEVLTYAVDGLRRHLTHIHGNGLGLLGWVGNLTLPNSLTEILGAGHYLELKIKRGGIRSGKSGMQLVPIEFKFDHQQQAGTVMLAVI